ncbi:MAG TPA: PadR family transcriptional regulator [Steroidobacteraceae bacterium]|jgi:DNA-binding PadR family transcriptional regulator
MAKRSNQMSPLAMAVLALLSEGAMHVYRMQTLIKRRGKDSVVNVTQRNSLYQTIGRLLRADLVRIRQTLQDEGRPERVVYEITDDGQNTLTLWLKDMLAAPANEYPEFPAALAHLPVLSRHDALRQLEQRIAALDRRLSDDRAQMRGFLALKLPRLFLIEDEYRQTVMKAELGWVKGLAEDLRNGVLDWNPKWLKKVAAEFEPQP